ncbi:S-adenosyl-L-methionine-dependent methyltransferase [Venustampulla echinocandica]|uniref:S-adenosyl-L-methionine-dependent methyltransferase n=1 Tax=Venustampulla echinocandica TaxID=2656787 RepID=A0A370U3F8_9HELO|nr:S-adenosyl-L-methionine-dependent methyltransferase [Venustampulla echinocandica]RDL42308.1 S-adenosyl-L-methionine-dependent methyltransferase [Venustampulla echinocandica]
MADDKMQGLDHSEAHYFNSYNHHGIHEEMLKDEVRTRSYMNAIVQNKHLFKDKIVLDVGCGTAILSMFAVKAGAKHVIGVDMSTIIEKAKEIVEVNGMSDKITLLQGKMEEVEVPFPKVDIIISEWMGYFLLYESMLDTVLYARDKYLAPNGLIFPDKATIFMAGIEDGEYKDEKIGFWDNVYGFDYSPLKKTALTEPLVDTVEIKAVVTDPTAVLTLDLYTCTTADLAFTSPFTLDARRDDFVHALIAWFDIDFTACHKPIRFSTGPHTKYTHWKQTVFYLREVLTVQQGEQIKGILENKPNEKNKRDLDVKIAYKLITDDPMRQAEGACTYKMC